MPAMRFESDRQLWCEECQATTTHVVVRDLEGDGDIDVHCSHCAVRELRSDLE